MRLYEQQSVPQLLKTLLREEVTECLQAPVTFVPSRIKSFETREESVVDREKARDRLACMVKEACFYFGVRR